MMYTEGPLTPPYTDDRSNRMTLRLSIMVYIESDCESP